MSVQHPLAAAIAVALALASNHVAAQSRQPGQEAPAQDPVTLGRVVVSAQAEQQARAIDVKRGADAILDAVSSDDVGDYPDQNVAESLSRLPGVSVTRDQGEGRYVVVRGLDAALNSVSVDGIAIGTPESDNRAAPMDVIPSESTERLVVVKSPTPDMPGDSIGGSILVESASAFDRDGRSIRAKLEANHQSLSGRTSPKGSFNFSDIYGNGTFGLAFGLNWQDRKFESDNTEGEYDAVDGGGLAMVEQQRRKYFIDRKRVGANLNLDWRPDGQSSYFLRTLSSSFRDAETRQNTVIAFDPDDLQADGEHLFSGPVDKISKRVRWRTKTQDTFAATAGGQNRFDRAMLDYQVGYTRTRERANDELEARFKYKGPSLDATIDQTGALPVIGVSGTSWEGNGAFRFDKFVLSPGTTNDDEFSAKVDLRFDRGDASYKFGLAGRWRDRDVDKNEPELSKGSAIDLSGWTVPPPAHRHNSLGDALSSAVLREFWAENASLYAADPGDAGANAVAALAEDYASREDILAGYAMGTWDVGALRLIAGVRVEHTRFSADGYRIDVQDDGETFATSALRASSSYTNVLPGVHLRWDGGDAWVFRLAATRSISRPGFGQIAPHAAINRDDAEVELGNPALDPYRSTNLDLAWERYIGKAGLLSLGLFHKSIGGYISDIVVDNNPDYAGYDVSTAINGKSATVRGAEFNWQQRLDFLPAGWDGLLAGASATWLHTKFDPGLDGRAGESFALPRASRNVYTAFLGYERGRVSTRLSAVHRSAYLDELGKGPGYDIYVAPNTQLDFGLEVQLSDAVQVYLEGSNLLDKPLERYQGTRNRTQQFEEYGRTFALGVKVKL